LGTARKTVPPEEFSPPGSLPPLTQMTDDLLPYGTRSYVTGQRPRPRPLIRIDAPGMTHIRPISFVPNLTRMTLSLTIMTPKSVFVPKVARQRLIFKSQHFLDPRYDSVLPHGRGSEVTRRRSHQLGETALWPARLYPLRTGTVPLLFRSAGLVRLAHRCAASLRSLLDPSGAYTCPILQRL